MSAGCLLHVSKILHLDASALHLDCKCASLRLQLPFFWIATALHLDRLSIKVGINACVLLSQHQFKDNFAVYIGG